MAAKDTADIYTKQKTSYGFEWAPTNNTFSGCDMVATITMQTPKGSIMQVLGNVQTLSYSISQNKTPVRCLGDINPKDFVDGPRTIAGSLVFTVFDRHWLFAVHDKLRKMGVYNTDHFIADELPPFDVTINFENEYGFGSRLAIYGIRLLNEGQTMSINDIYTENTYQYVAMDIGYMNQWYSLSDGEGNADSQITPEGQKTEITKPSETIPDKSGTEGGTVPPPEPPKKDDDYSFSTIKLGEYKTFHEYKTALDKQRDAYLAQAGTDTSLRQEVLTRYNEQIQAGIEAYN